MQPVAFHKNILFVSFNRMRFAYLLIALIASVAMADKFAIVMGTKDGWGNYSITSEPCRVWADLVAAGIKPENIIMMAYTTDLTSSRNPFPNMIFTDPADNTDRDWAKSHCFEHIDYTDKDINGDVFLGILSGDAEKVKEKTGKENPRVLAAGPEDTVFTYFIDHGNEGIICVGDDYVTDTQLIDALKQAHEKKIYGKWVFFMEACHSGSMFKDLPADWNIFVMTSSDAHHNANMSNCPPDDYIEDKHFGCCLSGLWDNSFLDYVEQHPDCTIGEIVDMVHDDVKKTSVQEVSHFGDMTFRDMKLSEFFGELPAKHMRATPKATSTSVDLADVPAHLAMWNAIRADKKDLAAALKEYQELKFAEAKREVEVMRLGRMLMNEKAADKALKAPAEAFNPACVRDLSLLLAKKCGHSMPFPESTNNMLRNICLPGLSVPNVDFNDICM